MKQLFEYCILFHQYKNTEKGKEYVDTIMVQDPKYILASSEKEVVFKATREVGDEYAKDPDNVQIIIRNF